MSATTPTSSGRDAKVFINYRREDASGYAGRLYEWLSERFGPDRVFMDISAIKPGVDFLNVIESEVAACEAVLVVIGRQWLAADADGQRRLDQPNDFVRLEIASALARNVLVVPVLVEDAAMPRERDLPDDLKPLARRQALEVSDGRWEFDVGRLIDALEERLEKRSGEEVRRRPAKVSPARRLDPRRYWQLFPVRLVAGLLVLAAALIPQLHFALRPEPVNLEDTGLFSPGEVKLGREELLIEGPSTGSEEGRLLSHVANPGEIVDVGFELATLDGDTIMQFSDSNPPTTATRVEYQTTKPEEPGGEPCRTFVEILLADSRKPPAALRLSQRGAPGGDMYRSLELKATGGELLVKVLTATPDGGSEQSPGCRKLLKVGPDFTSPTEPPNSVAVSPEEGSSTRLSFNPAASKNLLWDGPDGLFQPFDPGNEKGGADSPSIVRARAIEIRRLGDQTSGPPSVLAARSPDGGQLLNVVGLKLGSDRIHFNVSGRGLVQVNGEDYVAHLDRMKRHPLLTILLAAADAALFIWFVRLLFARRLPAVR